MTECIVWERPDGGITVTHPAYGGRDRPEGWTDDDVLSWALFSARFGIEARYGPCTPHIIEVTDLPAEEWTDRLLTNPKESLSLRDAWVWDVDHVDFDRPKARLVHMAHIREDRNRELKKLDISYMKALEAGDTAEQLRIATLKQTLRDIPQNYIDILEAITDPGLLKLSWPAELPARGS